MDNLELVQTLQRHNYVIKRQTDGLTHEQSLLQPAMRGNCMNWVLGHLLEGRNGILQQLDQPIVLPAPDDEFYKRESAPITPTSPAVPLQTLLAGLDEALVRIEQSLQSIAEEKMATIINEERQTTRRASISFSVWHEAYHLGQLEYLRQLTGVNDKVI
ncbi:MAG: DinB family protein [Caldilinea sp. CFX5]|nr:DinB family protein [Caldilinea sp. CFX5]